MSGPELLTGIMICWEWQVWCNFVHSWCRGSPVLELLQLPCSKPLLSPCCQPQITHALCPFAWSNVRVATPNDASWVSHGSLTFYCTR
jgi:hypothetical protein